MKTSSQSEEINKLNTFISVFCFSYLMSFKGCRCPTMQSTTLLLLCLRAGGGT